MQLLGLREGDSPEKGVCKQGVSCLRRSLIFGKESGLI